MLIPIPNLYFLRIGNRILAPNCGDTLKVFAKEPEGIHMPENAVKLTIVLDI